MTAVAELATVDRLPPISLEELTARAELQIRVDRKYMLPITALPAVLAELDENVLALETGRDGAGRSIRSAAYESVYFDTPGLVAFYMAAHGRRRRFKVRTRSYLDSGAAYLEVKTRGGRSTTVKDRLEYDPRDREVLTAEGLAYAGSVLSGAGIAADPPVDLAPILITRYRRATLLLPGGDGRAESRATIDTGLEWIDDGGRGLLPTRLSIPWSVIVETKSGLTAGALDRALWRHGHRPASLSKFGTGLAALRPDLPSNKWTRVLRRHFDAAITAA